MKKEISIWDRMAKGFHVTSMRSKAHRDKYRMIAGLIIKESPSCVLDLGCGSGILEKELYDLGYDGEIIAVDASESMIKIAQSLVNNDKCSFLVKDLEGNFDFGKKFDVVVSINLFFFLENKEKFLTRVRKCLNADSFFIMVNPKPSSESSNWAFVKEHFADTSTKEKALIFVNEIFNIPRYLGMAYRQNRLDRLSKKGVITHDGIDDIKLMAKNSKLDIIKTEDIHARQNWLFIMRRVFGE